MRIGFFGGSFDPPHRGHLAVALAAARESSLDKVLLAPTGRQPLKPHGPEASFADRLAMANLLCAGHPVLEPSALEAPRAQSTTPAPDGPNYTIDTLHRLRGMLAPSDSIYAIAGADAFLDLPRWRDPAGLLAIADWIVVARPAFSLERIESMNLTARQRKRIHLLTDVQEPASATEVRRRLSSGEDCTDLVPAPILDYIHQHRLYQ